MISPAGNEITSVKFHTYLYDDNRWLVQIDALTGSLPKYLTKAREGKGFSNLIDTMVQLRHDVRSCEEGRGWMRQEINKLDTKITELQRDLRKLEREKDSLLRKVGR